jgi:hypothetical protein
MLSFLSFVFWLAVFLGGAFFFVTCLMDTNDEEEQNGRVRRKILWNLTSLEHINSWESFSFIVACFLITLLGAWGIGFLYLFLWVFVFFLIIFIFSILGAAGIDSENLASSLMDQIKKINTENFKAYLPTYSLISSFFLVLLLNLGGMSEWDQNQSSSSKSSSSSSSSQYTKVKWTIDGNGCPNRNGDEWGSSPSSVAGRVFDIVAARNQSVGTAYSTCIQCIKYQWSDAYRKFGTTGSVSSPQYQYCETLLDRYNSNRTVWQQMQRESTYK